MFRTCPVDFETASTPAPCRSEPSVLVQRELESRSCPNWFGRGEATHLPPLGATDAGGLEFAIACLPDLSVPAGQAIVRRHVSDRAVQPPGVVLLHEVADDPPRVRQ